MQGTTRFSASASLTRFAARIWLGEEPGSQFRCQDPRPIPQSAVPRLRRHSGLDKSIAPDHCHGALHQMILANHIWGKSPLRSLNSTNWREQTGTHPAKEGSDKAVIKWYNLRAQLQENS